MYKAEFVAGIFAFFFLDKKPKPQSNNKNLQT